MNNKEQVSYVKLDLDFPHLDNPGLLRRLECLLQEKVMTSDEVRVSAKRHWVTIYYDQGDSNKFSCLQMLWAMTIGFLEANGVECI